jgi:dihydropyrimidinase
MAAFDTVTRHGTIATASETYQADVGIREGRIVAIGEALADPDEVVDVTRRARPFAPLSMPPHR